MTSSEYFPNNWELFNQAPDEIFEQHTFEEFMDWKVCGWELPRDIVCIIRAKNTNTGKIKEYTYRRQNAAQKRLMKLMDNPDLEIALVNHEAVHHIYRGEDY